VWVMGARVLILDETDSLLDRQASERLRARIASLPTDTIVLQVTTDADVASDADRVLVLHEGRLVADGAPDEVWPQLSDEVVERVGLPFVWQLSQKVSGAAALHTSSWETLVDALRGPVPGKAGPG